MLSIRSVQRKYGTYLCRRCMNREYHVNLKPKNCHYGYPYQHRCPVCNLDQNIVTDLRPSGHLKMLFRY